MVGFVIVKDWQWIVVLFKVLGGNLSLPITTLKKRQFDQCKKSNIKSDEIVVITGTEDNWGAELNGPTAWHWSWRHLVRHIFMIFHICGNTRMTNKSTQFILMAWYWHFHKIMTWHDKISPIHHQFSKSCWKGKNKICKPANAAEAGFD